MARKTPSTAFLVMLSMFSMVALYPGSASYATTVNPASAASSATADSATVTEIPENLTHDQINDLMARMSDQEVRELLIRQLDRIAVAEAEAPEKKAGIMMDRLAASLDTAEHRIQQVAGSIDVLPSIPGQIWERVSAGSDTTTWTVIFSMLLFFAVGMATAFLFRRFLVNVGKLRTPNTELAFKAKLRFAFLRSLIDVIALAIFTIATLIAWVVVDLPTGNADVLFTSLLSGVVVFRLVNIAFRFVLAPKVSWMRLVGLSDSTATMAYGKLMVLSGMLIVLIWLPGEVMRGFGFSPGERGLFTLLTSMIFILTLIAMIWKLRPAGADTTGSPIDSEDYFSRNWHIMAIVGVLFFYFLALGVNFATGASVLEPFIATLVVLGFIPIIDAGMRSWASNLNRHDTEPDIQPVDQNQESGEVVMEHPLAEQEVAEPAPRETGSYDRVIVSNMRIVLFIFSVFVIAQIWDLQLFGFLQALVGERTAKVLINISITAILAYALWGIISTAVARIAGPAPGAGGGHGGDEMGGGGGSRLGTVLPLFKKFMFITLMVMMVMIVLSSLGVDIGPLIAGAGIIGIAIGFGAQTLVKDIVSGLFFLLDDAFRVGEYVTIGDTKGTVEKISVRSLRLRHHNGPLHTVPFGEIQTLTNWSRDWAIMKFEIRVPFETDVDLVRRIIKKVGIAMLDDEELGPLFLAPLKSQGVNRMDDSSFIIRCKFTSIPGQQFLIRREAYMRIQHAFEEKGIKFAPRRVIVETQSAEGVDPKIAAAGAAALDAPNAQQDQGKDEPG